MHLETVFIILGFTGFVALMLAGITHLVFRAGFWKSMAVYSMIVVLVALFAIFL